MEVHGMNNPFPIRSTFGDAPVGSVLIYAGETSSPEGEPRNISPIEPLGWMVCDGRTLEPSHYPELFAVLGYRYGGQNDQFRIPDYRPDPSSGTGTGTSKGNDIRDAAYIIKFSYGHTFVR
ncbi:phage tail protein [Undibacterium sp. TC9W]|uniref:phage tail protein n=1 Tax=Undibacterium sp. TC9W TaxID=3413053 RepID=UPI003BF1F76F